VPADTAAEHRPSLRRIGADSRELGELSTASYRAHELLTVDLALARRSGLRDRQVVPPAFPIVESTDGGVSLGVSRSGAVTP
jgi:hypothetical protein